MAINYASKFDRKVAERYAHKSYTGSMAGNQYKFDGVKGISIYSVDTAPIVDYNMNATSNRYGTPTELGDYVQTLQMGQHKSFTYTIDKGNNVDQLNIKGAVSTLKRQIDERINPYMDKYNMKKWIHGAGLSIKATVAITANNALEFVQDCSEAADENAVPEGSRTLACTTEYAKLLKRSPQFQYTNELAKETLVKGQVGMLDGWKIVVMPKKFFPAGVVALAGTKEALLSPMKIKDYKIHTDPPGVNGNLVEGRFYHDAFVIDAKAKGVIAIATSSATKCANPAVAANGAVTVAGDETYYTADGSDPRCSGTRVKLTANGAATHTAGDTIIAISYNANAAIGWSDYVEVETTS